MKRWMGCWTAAKMVARRSAALCVIALLLGAAGALAATTEPFVLTLPSGATLYAPDGAALTEPGAYQAIERLNGLADGLFFSGTRTVDGAARAVLLGADGQPRAVPDCSALYAEDGVLFATVHGKTGAMRVSGEWIVPALYTRLVANGEGGFLALNTDPFDERPDGVYYIGGDGVEVATGIRVYYGLGAFSEGLMPVVEAGGRMGYLNARGEWAITPQYEYAGEFLGGVAEAGLTTGSGLIDMAGNWLVTPKYAAIDRSLKDGRMVLAQEDSSQVLLLDPDTFAVARRYEGDDIYFSACFDADLAVLYLDDCTRLIDAKGDVVLECGLNAGFDIWLTMGERIVVRQGEWGERAVWLYDMSGQELAGPFQELWPLGMVDGQPLFANISYDVVEQVDMDVAFSAFAEVEGTRRISVIDRMGVEVVAARAYTDLRRDESGVLVFESPTEVGAMDGTGRVIVSAGK